MFESIINKHLEFLQRYGVKMETEDDKDVYRYGMKVFYAYVVDITVIFFLAFCFGRLYETVIMTFVFALLQVFGGGYHANTKVRCTLSMLAGIFVGNILMIGVLVNYPAITMISGVIVSTFTFMFVPVANENHPISKKVYKRSTFIARLMIVMITFTALLFMILGKNTEMIAIITTLYLYSISLAFSKFINRKIIYERKLKS